MMLGVTHGSPSLARGAGQLAPGQPISHTDVTTHKRLSLTLTFSVFSVAWSLSTCSDFLI